MSHRLVSFAGPTRSLVVATTVVGIVAFTWPFLVERHAALTAGHGQAATWVFAALVPLLVLLAVAELRAGTMDVKTVALLAILAAGGAALRVVGAGIPGGEPLFALVVVAGRSLGRGFGYLYGATVLVTSALVTGFIGPWLPFQMIAFAWIGYLAGCLPRCTGTVEVAVLTAFGAAVGFAYGALLDLWFWPFQAGAASRLSFVPGGGLHVNLSHFATFYATTSLGFDTAQAVTNAVLLALAGPTLLAVLARATRRGAFGATAAFAPPVPGGAA